MTLIDKEFVHMAPDTFDTEATPESLAGAGLDWRTWGLYCLIAAVAMFFAVATFELGRAVGQDEMRHCITVEGRK